MQFRNIAEELQVTKFRKNTEREFEEYFESKGFSIIEPRVFQDYNDFIHSNLIKDSSKTVKVLGGDSKIYILRPDITTSILSQIFSKWEGEPPLKVYYNSKIFRNGSGGKISQNYQIGVESLGDDIPKADGEIIQMAASIMATLDQPYILEMGSSRFLEEVFKEMNLDLQDEIQIKDLISKKNRHGLMTKLGSLNLVNTILDDIFDLQGTFQEVIKKVRSYDINKEMETAIDSLERLLEVSTQNNIKDNIRLDLSMIADLDYYDGIIFRGYCLSVPTKILSGGRYDKSTAKYGTKVPAIGFMVDMDLVTRIRIKEVK